MSEMTTADRTKAVLQTVSEKGKILYQRAYRALTFDKSVYSEAKDDPEATIPSAIMPFLIEIAFLVIVGIAFIPLWFLYGSRAQFQGNITPAQWAAGIGIGIVASVVFFLGTFLVWVVSQAIIARFAGVKELQIKQVLRSSAFTFVPLFFAPFVVVGAAYAAVAGSGIGAAAIVLIGGGIIFILVAINNIFAFREITGVTTGVSIMSTVFALVLAGIIMSLIGAAFGLTIAGIAALL
jgi:hypothetical protein